MTEQKQFERTPEEIEATVLKLRAEADEKASLALKAAAEARAAEHLADMQSRENDRDREKRKRELTSDSHHHVYYFNGGVDSSSCTKAMDALTYWRRTESPNQVEIIFQSPGGSVIPGMALFDYIRAMQGEGWKVNTTTYGMAASMGGILLQAGDRRRMGREAYILIHEISSGAVGKIGELEDEIEFVKKIQARVVDIFVQRSEGKLTRSKLVGLQRRKDFWLDSKDAVRYGIVDDVI